MEPGLARRAALFLTPRLPWPLDDGGRIVGWQTLWSASQDHDVTVLSFVRDATEAESVPAALAARNVTVERVTHRPPPGPVAAARGLFGRWPYTLLRYQSPEFARRVLDRVGALRPAYAIANHLHMAPYVGALGGVPMVLRAHNLEHVWMDRYARGLGAHPAGWYARAQAGRLRRAEAELCRSASLVLAIQEREAAALRALAPGARVETVPVGVDLDRYLPRSPAAPPIVLLAGSFAWPPNVDGALRFLEEGWPRLRESAHGVRLRIAGKSPPEPLVRAAERAGAEVAADVPSMAEEFARASALVVPLWVGAGARVKIVEAMAAGLPVASTAVGAEGLGAEPGTHYLEGDSARSLAEAVVGLLRDPARAVAITGAARRLAEERWALRAVSERQRALVAEISL
jgi:glycosyltransferase involved in cell wall biosynthesis